MNNILNLYNHNIIAFNRVLDAYNNGEDKVAIVKATGTGKSYIALRLAYEYKDKKVLYISPSGAIIEHVQSIIKDNPYLDINRDFPNLEFRTYQSLINLSREELSSLDIDLLITDELHHLGAPVWGSRINTIIDTHPNMKVFGMTAYTVRDRGTAYERDMTNPDREEVFSGKVVSTYDLCDAMIDGVLPKPIYRSAYINLEDFESSISYSLEEKLSQNKISKEEYSECKRLLLDAERTIHKAPVIPELVRSNIKKDGKYIYFCPMVSDDNTNDIDAIMKEAKEWFKDYDVVYYKTTSKDKDSGRASRHAFYQDKDLEGNNVKNKLRIMFAINQYNEGVHAPDVDGVILGRKTSSDIVYFEQIGRALSVKGNTKEQLEKYSSMEREELLNIALSKGLKVDKDVTKEEVIEKLLSPVIIDLTNNIEFIEELENNLKDRVKEVRKNNSLSNHREIKIQNLNFDIITENKDLYEILRYVRDRINPNTWEVNYNLAKAYYNHYHDLEVPRGFKTTNGYEEDENGYNLGSWVAHQRQSYKNGKLSLDKIKLLEEIGMRFENKVERMGFGKWYNLTSKYYEYYHDLEVPQSFKTINGYEKNENGYNLGSWVAHQRKAYKKGTLSEDKIKLLEEVGMRFDNKRDSLSFEEWYNLALAYYNHYYDLEVPVRFKTINGYEKDDDGYNLGRWIVNQRKAYKKGTLTEEEVIALKEIDMRFENRVERKPLSFEEWYNLAQVYYNHYHDLEVPTFFKTINGYEEDEDGYNFGVWIAVQRQLYKNSKLSLDKIKSLEEIGMRFENKLKFLSFEKWYALALVYYNHYHNLEVPTSFKTINGYEEDENGYNLGRWISKQRMAYKKGTLTEEKVIALKEIDMRFENRFERKPLNFEKWYNLALVYYNHYHDLEIPYNFKTINGYEKDEDGYNLGVWVVNQRVAYKKGTLTENKIKMLEEIGMRFENRFKFLGFEKWYALALIYYNHYHNLEVPLRFKTINGYEEDGNGYNLGGWISTQRELYKKGKLDEYKIKLLKEIDMRFEKKSLSFEEWYNLAFSYYRCCHNLEIPRSFKTLNGYNLGGWISTQRKLYKNGKLDEDKIRMLEDIGMVWRVYNTDVLYESEEVKRKR